MKRRPLDFRSFDDLRADLALLETRGYDRAGRWSLGQAAEHMTKAMAASVDGFGMKPPLIFKLLGPMAKKYILTKRKMPSGVPAPKIFKPMETTADVASDATGLADFRRTLDRYQAFTGTLQPSPVVGELTREEYDQLHLIHAAHHLSFLRPK